MWEILCVSGILCIVIIFEQLFWSVKWCKAISSKFHPFEEFYWFKKFSLCEEFCINAFSHNLIHFSIFVDLKYFVYERSSLYVNFLIISCTWAIVRCYNTYPQHPILLKYCIDLRNFMCLRSLLIISSLCWPDSSWAIRSIDVYKDKYVNYYADMGGVIFNLFVYVRRSR